MATFLAKGRGWADDIVMKKDARYARFALIPFLMLATGCSLFSKSGEKLGGSSSYSGYGAASVNEKTLKEFAPPPLPTETIRFVRNILEVQTPGTGLIAPGEKKAMFFTWAITGASQVWKMDNPMAFPIQMTSGEDPTSLVDFTPDGQYAIVSRDHAGEEDPGIYLLPVNGGPLIEVQHKPKVKTSYAWAGNDGQTIYFMANDVTPDSFALHSWNMATRKTDVLFSEPGNWFVADVFGDRIFLLGKAKSPTAFEYWVFQMATDPKERQLRPVIGQDEMTNYDVSFGANPGEFLILTNKFRDLKALYVAKNGKMDKVSIDDNNEIESFTIDHFRYRIYLQRNVGGRSELEVLNARTFDTLKFPNFGDMDQVRVSAASRLGRYAFIGTESSNVPRSNYVYDWANAKLSQWNRSGMPEVDASVFRKSTLESYPARDGTKIPMFVTRPAKCAADPCPVIVSFHGGPEAQARPFFNRRAQIFAAAGFIYVEPNVRGSDGYGKAYRAADDGPKRLDVITDIEDAATYIKKQWAKDGRAPKVGVFGGSYGGYSVLMAMSRFAGAYDAGVSNVGMSNLRSFLLNTASYRRAMRVAEYGDPDKDRDALEKLSPTTYLKQIKDPLMVIQGVSDPRVPVGEAVQIHELLKKRGVDSPLILISGEGHGSKTRDNQVVEMGHTLRFFQTHLLKK